MLLTADQHRNLARQVRDHAGEPGYPTIARAAQMARNHEIMAKMIEARQRRDGYYVPTYWNAPPLTPA